MHSDLSPHLHSDECNALIAALKKCHADNPFKRFLGVCTEADRQMTNCLKRERESKRRANKDKGPIKKKQDITIHT
ncbi:cox assembly mitochondrial protein 2 [Plakobranchus ocellatus]|uniref:COX assembly mitochondrial protein n=1 Tax=Plakobranchus ocellatus TaxID=259542 RepID=A0AAV3Z147_9GAST|nr:cox assembly mitochondrial protein 2 [Plakobranchus ocellatus]